MRVLITGASGFIGSHLCRKLLTQHQVFAVARRRTVDEGETGIRWIEADLTRSLDRATLPRNLDAIIHLAQSKFYREFPDQASDIFEVNTQSTFQLLEYGRVAGIKHFIYSSSGGVYGFREEGFEETDPVNTLNFYLSSKYCAELLMANYKPFFHTIVLRLFFVYGEGQSSSMLMPRLIRSVREGEPITLQGTDGIRINPTYVSDVVDAFERALSLDGSHLINVAGPEVLSLREIGQAIGKQLGREPIFDVQQDQEPGHLLANLTEMKRLLGGPRVVFSEGIARMCGQNKERRIG